MTARFARWKELADLAETAAALEALGWLLVHDAGDDEASLRAFDEARGIRQELDDRDGETRAFVGVCQVLVALGDVERAATLSLELLERANGDLRTRHFALHFLVSRNRCTASGFTCLAFWDGRYDRPFSYTHHAICHDGKRRIDMDEG